MKKPLFYCLSAILVALSYTSCNKKDATPVPPVPPPPPVSGITNISPNSGGYGIIIKITGKGFSASAANNVVKVNSIAAIVKTASTTELEIEIPKASGTGPVTVETAGKTLTGPNFNYIKTSTVSSLAGSGEAGFADGQGDAAQFKTPGGLAVDAAGNIYVADFDNNRIRKITPNGLVSTFAGSGAAGDQDGISTSAEFNGPTAVGIDANGNIYVTEVTRLRKITATGVVTTLAGSSTAGYVDAIGSAARFESLFGITIDDQNNIYVSDFNRIRKITTAGVVSTFAGSDVSGNTDGIGTMAQFSQLFGMSIDAQGNIFVADNNNGTVRKITPTAVVTKVTSSWSGSPVGISIDPDGVLYILNANSSAQHYTVEKITINGESSTFAGLVTGGNGHVDGPGAIAQFNNPFGIAIDKEGNFYIADTDNNLIRKIITEL